VPWSPISPAYAGPPGLNVKLAAVALPPILEYPLGARSVLWNLIFTLVG